MDRHRLTRIRQQMNALTLIGTAYDGFVNRRSAVRVCRSAQIIGTVRAQRRPVGQALRPTIPLDELIAYLIGADSSLAAEVGPWLVASSRFRAFAETYRDKIRKKVRGLRDDNGRRDLVFELGIALRLLEERRFALEYESYG